MCIGVLVIKGGGVNVTVCVLSFGVVRPRGVCGCCSGTGRARRSPVIIIKCLEIKLTRQTSYETQSVNE